MPPPLVFLEVLSPGEARAGASIAVGKGAVQWLFRRQMHPVHLALVAKQSSGVGEAQVEFTPGLATLVGSLVSVHVLVPLAHPLEGLALALAVDVVAEHLVAFVARRRPVAADGVDRSWDCRCYWDDGDMLVRHGQW